MNLVCEPLVSDSGNGLGYGVLQVASRVGEEILALFSHGCIVRVCCIPWYVYDLQHTRVPGHVVLKILCLMNQLVY